MPSSGNQAEILIIDIQNLTVTIRDGIFNQKVENTLLAVVNVTISEKFSLGPSMKFYFASFGDMHPNWK